MAIFGQDAHSENKGRQVPESHRHAGREIVGVNFVDQLFRYCADDRFPDDHGFFILEQDFRFYHTDCLAFDRLHAKGVDTGALSPDLFPFLKPYGESPAPTPELRDLLAYVTAARRWGSERCPGGHHDLIWFSWEPRLRSSESGHYHWSPHPGESREHVPGTGNYMWWVTARGARHIRQTVLVGPALLRMQSWRESIRTRLGACAGRASARRQERSALARAQQRGRAALEARVFSATPRQRALPAPRCLCVCATHTLALPIVDPSASPVSLATSLLMWATRSCVAHASLLCCDKATLEFCRVCFCGLATPHTSPFSTPYPAHTVSSSMRADPCFARMSTQPCARWTGCPRLPST